MTGLADLTQDVLRSGSDVGTWLADNERVLGFIHVGTAQAPGEERERPDPADLTTELAP